MIARESISVLVVDDTPALRYARGKAIARAGFQVIEAENGVEALERASQAQVVVLDVFLPDISGFEVCRILRSHADTATMPIIHISAVFVTDTHAGAGTGAGADAYLIEPVPPEVLVQVIDSTLAARAPRQRESVRTASR